jgi:hypothetical protein
MSENVYKIFFSIGVVTYDRANALAKLITYLKSSVVRYGSNGWFRVNYINRQGFWYALYKLAHTYLGAMKIGKI